MALARQLVPQTEQTYAVEVPATVKKGGKQPNRLAQIRLAWTQLCMPAPSYVKGYSGMEVWIVRAWEPAPPVGAEAVEWILLTSLAVNDWDGARYLTQIYECRWRVGVSREGFLTQSVQVRPRLTDSGLVAREAPGRESQPVKPSDTTLGKES